MNYQDNKKKRTEENAVKWQAGSRVAIAALLAMLFCTACGQKSNPENPVTVTPSEQEITSEATPVPTTAEDDVSVPEVWTKRAVIMGEDVFFASMPESWKIKLIYREDGNNFEAYICSAYDEDESEENMLSADDGWNGPRMFREFSLTSAENWYSSDKERLNEVKKESVEETGGYYLWKDEEFPVMFGSGEKCYNEFIVSPDEKYVFSTQAMKEYQYQQYQEYAAPLYDSIKFQRGQIGEKQETELSKREKVRVYGCGLIMFEAEVPEGIHFEVNANPGTNYSIFFYLDDSKKSYVELFYEKKEYRAERFYEIGSKFLAGEDYKEAAEYYSYTYDGVTLQVTQFWYSHNEEPVFAEFHVPEGEEELLQVALDIVKSIDLY